jgi:hypothetical protein
MIAPGEAVRLLVGLAAGAAFVEDGEEAVDAADLTAALTLMPMVRAEVDQLEASLLMMARGRGMTWQELAFGLGLGSAQAARQRYERLTRRAAPDNVPASPHNDVLQGRGSPGPFALLTCHLAAARYWRELRGRNLIQARMATATSSQGENRRCTAKPTMVRATMTIRATAMSAGMMTGLHSGFTLSCCAHASRLPPAAAAVDRDQPRSHPELSRRAPPRASVLSLTATRRLRIRS